MKIRLPKRRRYRVVIYVGSLLLVLLALDMAWVRVCRRVTVGVETTRITAPLTPDGMPDYAAYIDDRLREGMTAENNAFIKFMEISTPTRYDAAGHAVAFKELYQRLSLAPPKEVQRIVYCVDYLKAKTPSVEATEANYDEFDLVEKHPWRAAEHPDVVGWLASQEQALSMAPAITARARWYVPVMRDRNGLLMEGWLEYPSQSRTLCDLLLTRAMREISEKRYAEAQADILACHRLARLLAQGWALIDYLVADTLDFMALRADATLAADPDLPPALLRQFRAEWESLAPWLELGRVVEFERYELLDMLTLASKDGKIIDQLIADMRLSVIETGVPPWAHGLILQVLPGHYNAALRETNAFWDQLADAAKLRTAPQREDRAMAVNKALLAYGQRHQGVLSDPARRVVAQMVILADRFYSRESNGNREEFVRHDVHAMTTDLTRVALALAAYRADHAAYPEVLEALTPGYLKEVPADIFSLQPLHYRRTEAGYVLYSVGANRQDDGGKPRVWMSGQDMNLHNDIVIQVPEPKP